MVFDYAWLTIIARKMVKLIKDDIGRQLLSHKVYCFFFLSQTPILRILSLIGFESVENFIILVPNYANTYLVKIEIRR